jgi:hypothetical protein
MAKWIASEIGLSPSRQGAGDRGHDPSETTARVVVEILPVRANADKRSPPRAAVEAISARGSLPEEDIEC